MGFACNLYGDYALELVKENKKEKEAETKNIMELQRYGEKIRERAYHVFPDDIWTMRGYAWSIHSTARFKISLYEEKVGAVVLYKTALKIREKCEEKYPEDLGVKEDIFKNCIELAKISPDSHGHAKEKAFMVFDYIKKKEGTSPRIKSFYLKLKELDKELTPY